MTFCGVMFLILYIVLTKSYQELIISMISNSNYFIIDYFCEKKI